MKSTSVKRSVLASVALLCATTMAGAALASQPDSSTATVVVAYQDLNLENPQALTRLYHRIESAAEQVCGRVSSRELRLYALYRECRDQAMSQAVEQIDVPSLTALHRTKSIRARV